MNTKKTLAILLGLFALALASFLLTPSSVVHADQPSLLASQASNAMRACSFKSVSTKTVAVSSTSARLLNVTGLGAVRIICTKDAHMAQGPGGPSGATGQTGTTGPTATTGDLFVPALTPEYFWSDRDKFAFIRDSADGTCYVSECK